MKGKESYNYKGVLFGSGITSRSAQIRSRSSRKEFDITPVGGTRKRQQKRCLFLLSATPDPGLTDPNPSPSAQSFPSCRFFPVLPGSDRASPSSGEGLISTPTPSPWKPAWFAVNRIFRGEGPSLKSGPSPLSPGSLPIPGQRQARSGPTPRPADRRERWRPFPPLAADKTHSPGALGEFCYRKLNNCG